MAIPNDVSPERRFVPSVLPWILAAVAFLVYLLTLNHWVSLTSVGSVAMVSRWNWLPELNNPLYWLVTFPIHFLPDPFIPVALNLFSATCAALVIALLARSVALLPHDRTEAQRLRERSASTLLSIRSAWLGPVLAVLACGLQLTFWESATAASTEIFDLLLFAYVVRCVLEFRLQGSDSWLLRAGFIYAAAMTSNWAMIAFVPVFLVALIWVKGVGFFNFRFLRQLFLVVCMGLCLYLLLPVMAYVRTGGELGIWGALKAHLGEQKHYLAYLLNKHVLFDGERPLWVLALPSLLPALAISVRWPSYFGDPSKLGVALATFVFHFLHAVLLVFCLWVALDPQFSPRHYIGLAALPLYYLGALSIGYFAGYFLLVFGGARPMLRSLALPGYPAPLNALVTLAVWLLLLAAPAALLYRNLPEVRTTNGPMLWKYIELTAGAIPGQNSIVLSDDSTRLMLLKSFWTQKRKANHGILLDTRALSAPAYHWHLAKEYRGRWKADLKRKTVFQPTELQKLIVSLSSSNSVYYLHPSFGYYFEKFYPEPHGLVYRLNPYSPDVLLKPPLSPAVIAENEAFWSTNNPWLVNQMLRAIEPLSRKDELASLARLFEPALKRAHLPKQPNRDAFVLALFSSRALNAWGVEMQRQGKLEQAANCFITAKRLYTNNVAAEINLECNRNLQGSAATAGSGKSMEQQMGRYRTIQDILNESGPLDDATFCFRLGMEFFTGSNFRQAADQFNRVTQICPEDHPGNLEARLLLARSAVLSGLADEGLKVINDIHAHATTLGVCQTNAPNLLQVEAITYLLLKHDTNTAEQKIQAALKEYPGDGNMLATVSGIYLDSGLYSNALGIVEQQLKASPSNTSALFAKGRAYLGLNAFNDAIAAFTTVVEMGTNAVSPEVYYWALNNRGFASWKADSLEEAQRDYQVLLNTFTNAPGFAYNLGEIAYKRKDTNAAIRYYERFLQKVPTNSIEGSNVLARLKELRGASR